MNSRNNYKDAAGLRMEDCIGKIVVLKAHPQPPFTHESLFFVHSAVRGNDYEVEGWYPGDCSGSNEGMWVSLDQVSRLATAADIALLVQDQAIFAILDLVRPRNDKGNDND